ncbi:hypothetical protein FQN50_004239 [Emmonsiellopsis sp. PD_5]|nr:hypothetical protein FQN50_004239 [Emmonsiellopsis sp. PD_5]
MPTPKTTNKNPRNDTLTLPGPPQSNNQHEHSKSTISINRATRHSSSHPEMSIEQFNYEFGISKHSHFRAALSNYIIANGLSRHQILVECGLYALKLSRGFKKRLANINFPTSKRTRRAVAVDVHVDVDVEIDETLAENAQRASRRSIISPYQDQEHPMAATKIAETVASKQQNEDLPQGKTYELYTIQIASDGKPIREKKKPANNTVPKLTIKRAVDVTDDGLKSDASSKDNSKDRSNLSGKSRPPARFPTHKETTGWRGRGRRRKCPRKGRLRSFEASRNAVERISQDEEMEGVEEEGSIKAKLAPAFYRKRGCRASPLKYP